MFRNRALDITILALILTSLACNAFTGSFEPLPPPPTTAVDEIPAATTAEPVATVTLSALSPLSTSRVTVLVDLNIRSGPGVKYDRVGFLLKDESVPVVGVHLDTGWWKIECPAIVSESECWVSGGEQYTRAQDVDGVAEAEAPPTPTPIPPTLEEGFGILAFIDNGALFAAKLDLTKNPPQLASEAIQLTDVVNVQSLSISPDGRRIAFISGSSEANILNAVNTDGQDLRTLLISTDLPLDINQNGTELTALIDQIAWLPDSTSVAFNTAVGNLSGPGIESQEDLWTVTLDGEMAKPFPAGTGGGTFVLSMNNKVLLNRLDNIARADMDGSNSEIILQFEPVNTASEYVFYPVPQQAGEGETFAYIPDAEPWLPGAWTTLWKIPGSGPAGQLGSIDGVSLFDPVLWSPDGSRLAFIRQTAEPDTTAMYRLVIADGKGINANPYAGGDMLALHGWGSDSTNFLYSGNGFYAVGRVNAPPVQILLSPGQQISDAQWLTDETFVAAVGFPENSTWELIGSGISEEHILLKSIRGFEALFDVWRP